MRSTQIFRILKILRSTQIIPILKIMRLTQIFRILKIMRSMQIIPILKIGASREIKRARDGSNKQEALEGVWLMTSVQSLPKNSAALCFSTSRLTRSAKTSLGNSLYSLRVSRSS